MFFKQPPVVSPTNFHVNKTNNLQTKSTLMFIKIAEHGEQVKTSI